MVHLAGAPLHGVLPITILRTSSCSPPSPPPPTLDGRLLHFAAAYHEESSHADEGSANDDALRIHSINCGGLHSKVFHLLCLLQCREPDVVCLQETGGALDQHTLDGMPYTTILGPPVRGGGLAMLIHLGRRLLGKTTQRLMLPNALVVTVRLPPIQDSS